jgi:hypothetical protein
MWVRDRLDGLSTDADFADWYPANGRRGFEPARLVLVSVLQYAENLTGRQAADAVHGSGRPVVPVWPVVPVAGAGATSRIRQHHQLPVLAAAGHQRYHPKLPEKGSAAGCSRQRTSWIVAACQGNHLGQP